MDFNKSAKKKISHWQLDCTRVERTSLLSRQMLPTVDVGYRWPLDRWPVMHMHPARHCSASCRGLTSEKEGSTLPVAVSSTHYRKSSLRPSTSGPDLPTGSWDLQDPVMTGGSFISAEQGDCGKSFSIFNETQLFQSEGWRETCIYCQLTIQYNLGHSKVEEWRQIKRKGALLDIILENMSKILLLKVPLSKKNWCLKQ